ncbi:radical SAM protein [Desulfonema magnum]|nr:radical SAM protein [Desulfonema magnum]
MTNDKSQVKNEIGTIRKDRRGRLSVALVYPNTYHVGMSNLGFQTVYQLLNQMDEVVCERAFVPERSEPGRITTAESGSVLSDFDMIAFSVSYENDYLNLLTIFEKTAIPPLSEDRNDAYPLIIAGGVACFLNPEPIAPFIDCFLIGEAEILIPRFFEVLKDTGFFEKKHFLNLKALAQNVPGVYVPKFYKTICHKDGTIRSVEPLCDVPAKTERVFLKDLSQTPTCSAILTPDTIFRKTFLAEVSRGCPHGCRFCSAGYVYRPPRFRPVSLLKQCMEQGMAMTDRIGLVGAAVSDLPGLEELCSFQENARISFSSLRADALTPQLVSALKKSRVKTATIAPDAGSERMRRVINKGMTEEDILNAADLLVSNGIPNLKLYFMTGLPTETMEDVEAIVSLCKQIKQRFLASSRINKRIGEITVSLNAFVPKPFTPFQWAPMDDVRTLKKKIKWVKNGLKRVANVRFHGDIPRQAKIQALLSRGDRNVADILSLAHKNKHNWPKTIKESPLNLEDYIYRTRAPDEYLPWDIIHHGINKSFLKREYDKAMGGETSSPCRMESSCHVCGVCKE